MSAQSSGAPDAIRVKSRKPLPQTSNAATLFSATCMTSSAAIKCGRWLIAATISSCFSTLVAKTFVPRSCQDLGTKVFATSVEKHDEMVAAMSHLPHLIAALLVIHVAENDVGALDLCGSGFRDLTRIASGAPELWADIL